MKLWDRRSKLFGDSLSSVMEQSFPQVVNEAIHAIHLREITSAMPNSASRVLDVGCGWGRLASDLVASKDTVVYGIDVAPHFVKLFNKRLKNKGKAVVGNMQKLSFANNSFDLVYCVVALMYLPTSKDQEKAISEMLRVLRKKGKLVLVEPNFWGAGLVRLGGLVPFVYRILLKRPKVETYGISFRLKDVESLIRISGGEIVYRRGYPFLTLLLLPTIAVGKVFPKVAQILLLLASILDRFFSLVTPSYFVTWVIEKRERLSKHPYR